MSEDDVLKFTDDNPDKGTETRKACSLRITLKPFTDDNPDKGTETFFNRTILVTKK